MSSQQKDQTSFAGIAAHALDFHGYRVVRTLRQVGICHWILVRRLDDGRMMEAECYDKALTNALLLLSYRNHLQQGAGQRGRGFRFPQAVGETERVLFWVRPFVAGEPLYRVLLRSGSVGCRKTRRVVIGVGKILRPLAARPSVELTDWVANLFIADTGEVLLDAPVVGPWITLSEAKGLIAPLLQPGLTPQEQVQVFMARLFVRLATGGRKPEVLEPGTDWGPRERAVLARIVAHPDDGFWVDAALIGHHRMQAITRPRVWGGIGAVLVLVGAFFWHFFPQQTSWQGKVGALPDVVRTTADSVRTNSMNAAELTESSGAVPELPAVREPVQSACNTALREARCGDFAGAWELLENRTGVKKISATEEDKIQQTRTAVRALMDQEFQRVQARAVKKMKQHSWGEALDELNFILSAFPPGDEVRRAEKMEGDIYRARLAERRQHESSKRRLQQIVQWEKRRLLHIDAMRRHYGGKRTARELKLFQKQAETPAMRSLLQRLIRIHQAESNLLLALPKIFKQAPADQVQTAFSRALGKRLIGRVGDVSADGLTEILPETVETLPWDDWKPQELYLLFAGLRPLAANPEQWTDWLYLFCLGRNLADEAAGERGRLSPRLAGKEADMKRYIADRRQILGRGK